MTNIQIAVLELLSVGGIGLLLTIAGVIVAVVEKKKASSCTAKTTGIVIKHSYRGNGNISPVVRYNISGTDYTVRRKYRWIITTSSNLPTKKNVYVNSGAYIDDKDCLHLRMGMVTDLNAVADGLWPIGSNMEVFYNPQNPKSAFAQRIPSKVSAIGLVFIWSGIGIIVLSALMAFVIAK